MSRAKNGKGNQVVQQVKARLKAIYLSGWQIAADANLAGQMYPDQSLSPAVLIKQGSPLQTFGRKGLEKY